MKKADAASAAELRLARVAWVPEIFTDREIPAVPSWSGRDAEEDEDEEDGDGDGDEDSGADGDGADSTDGTDAQDGDDADTAPGTGAEHINDTPPDTAAVSAPTSPHSTSPSPTTDGVSIGQSGPLAA